MVVVLPGSSPAGWLAAGHRGRAASGSSPTDEEVDARRWRRAAIVGPAGRTRRGPGGPADRARPARRRRRGRDDPDRRGRPTRELTLPESTRDADRLARPAARPGGDRRSSLLAWVARRDRRGARGPAGRPAAIRRSRRALVGAVADALRHPLRRRRPLLVPSAVAAAGRSSRPAAAAVVAWTGLRAALVDPAGPARSWSRPGRVRRAVGRRAGRSPARSARGARRRGRWPRSHGGGGRSGGPRPADRVTGSPIGVVWHALASPVGASGVDAR